MRKVGSLWAGMAHLCSSWRVSPGHPARRQKLGHRPPTWLNLAQGLLQFNTNFCGVESSKLTSEGSGDTVEEWYLLV